MSDVAARVTMPFPRRSPDLAFDPGDVPMRWFADDEYVTAHLIALSLSFPLGEQFFIDSVRAVRDRLRDPELEAQVTGFFGQESVHAKHHHAFNEMLRRKGFDPDGEVEQLTATFSRWVRKHLSAEAQLAYTVASEHWTAVMGERMLASDAVREKFHPSVRDLWMWHALEELEHKAVAFDVFQAVSGSYRVRAGMMLVASLAFGLGLVTHPKLMAQVGWRPSLRERIRGLGHMFGRDGLFEGFASEYVRYFRPGFHPNEKDTRALVVEWRARLFGEGGPLAGAREAWPERSA
jgi:uncharacterized protein